MSTKTRSLRQAVPACPTALAGALLLGAALIAPASRGAENSAASAAKTALQPWMQQLGVAKGICVLVGDQKAGRAIDLARATELLVYVQLPQAEDVAAARRAVDAAGLYGTRIWVERGPYARLHLADDVADALVAVGEAAAMPEAEALRVVHPQATVRLGEKQASKPIPAGVDDWSHPYHLPDNNPVSRDQLARAPYLTHFLSDPRYAPLPQMAVASAGRIFKAFGHIAFKTREEPWLDTLAAFNGYNGTLLWRRATAPALMVHRNTLIATPDSLYFGDDRSCKVFDAATGALRDEIAPPEAVAGGTFWKWMALENGVLYAVIGEQEKRDPVIRAKSENHGWPWAPLSPGFNADEHTWGFGRTLLAIDPKTKKVLWRHRETEPMDCRAVCMKNGRIYTFRFGAYLACLDAATGKELWRQTRDNAPELFKSLGEYSKRQDWRTNWRTVAFLKCSDQGLYFAGPAVDKLLAVSTKDGSVLWEHRYNNYQIVIRADGIYGVGGQIDKDPARKFDPLTGKVLEEIPFGRRACTRVTASIDGIFCRAGEGSARWDMASNHPRLVSPMRPNCHDGVDVANGLLYWWPSVCDCNLTLYGITCLGPAGNFDFDHPAAPAERLERFAAENTPVATLAETAADWPMFRANRLLTTATEASVPTKVHQLWQSAAPAAVAPTAPTAVGNLVFLGGSDGIVRALSAASGQPLWSAYTGGDLRYPPTIWQGRALVGSGDGYVYAFEAATGRPLWRFRAAPVERRIPVYGSLQSTWPVGTGVTVADGVAYAAAGIVNYDGTHVYALDARTGALKWENNSSGHLDPDAHTGVSVQGFMLVRDGRLFLPGGNAVSPAMYDIRDGKCLNDVAQVRRTGNNNVPGSFSPRGSELYCVGDQVRVAGKPHYAHPKYQVYDGEVLNKTLLAESGDRAVTWVNNTKLACYNRGEANLPQKLLAAWGRPRVADLKAVWEAVCKDSVALAVAPNAVVVARTSELLAFDLRDGRQLWSHPLPAAPVPWGLCVSRAGNVIVALDNGRVLCLSSSEMAGPQ